MGHALVQHLIALPGLVALAALAACATAPVVPGEEPAPEILLRTEKVYVATSGDDGGSGSSGQPLRTLGFATARSSAAEVIVLPGIYEEPEVLVPHGVKIHGPAEGGATIRARVVIRGKGVSIDHLELAGGVALTPGAEAAFDHVAIRPGTREDAIAADRSRISLEEAVVTCGAESCLGVKGSTVALARSNLEGGTAKRALRAETSSVSASGLFVTGSSINQLLASRHTKLTVRESTLKGAAGSAVAAVQGSTLVLEATTISEAVRLGILLAASKATIRRVLVEPTKGYGIGVTGGEVDVESTTLESSTDGGMTISAFADKSPVVRLKSTLIRHGKRAGIVIGSGDLSIEASRFVGAGGQGDDGDAITASGPEAIVRVLGAEMEQPTGFGVSLTNGAQGTITATISRPSQGGIYVEGAVGSQVLIRGSRVEHCGNGSGIVVHDATDVAVVGSSVTDCPEAGLLAGMAANVELTRSHFTKNGRYGIAAFGGATIAVTGTKASGAHWVTFATCADGARVDDQGDNRFQGLTTTCP